MDYNWEIALIETSQAIAAARSGTDAEIWKPFLLIDKLSRIIGSNSDDNFLLIQLIIKMSKMLGYNVGRADGEDGAAMLLIDLPTGQVRFDVPYQWIVMLEPYFDIWAVPARGWDGHTMEQRKERVAKFV